MYFSTKTYFPPPKKKHALNYSRALLYYITVIFSYLIYLLLLFGSILISNLPQASLNSVCHPSPFK